MMIFNKLKNKLFRKKIKTVVFFCLDYQVVNVISTLIKTMAIRLHKQGIKVHVITRDSTLNKTLIVEEHGIIVHKTPIIIQDINFLNKMLPNEFKISNDKFEILHMSMLWRLYKELLTIKQTDIVVAFSPSSPHFFP